MTLPIVSDASLVNMGRPESAGKFSGNGATAMPAAGDFAQLLPTPTNLPSDPAPNTETASTQDEPTETDTTKEESTAVQEAILATLFSQLPAVPRMPLAAIPVDSAKGFSEIPGNLPKAEPATKQGDQNGWKAAPLEPLHQQIAAEAANFADAMGGTPSAPQSAKEKNAVSVFTKNSPGAQAETFSQPGKPHEYMLERRFNVSIESRGTGGAKADPAMPITPPKPDFAPSGSGSLAPTGLTTDRAQASDEPLKNAAISASDKLEKACPEPDPAPANGNFAASLQSPSASGERVAAGNHSIETPDVQPEFSSALDRFREGFERIRQHGESRVDLQLALEGGAHVHVQLRLQAGLVHASLTTASVELREALRQQWTQLSGRNEGLQFADPIFEQVNHSFSQHQARDEGRHSPGEETATHSLKSSQQSIQTESRNSPQPHLAVSPNTHALSAWA